ncbi:Hsp20/alpha crystallin family protein [Dactylosporangium sp. NPDC000555]|uniref:Hsp20/alpha crystallin family protein n=1 Tax=Dactylosporangium sp. NPDC000555 TaxID=3154260 RepID=UPI0033347DFA
MCRTLPGAQVSGHHSAGTELSGQRCRVIRHGWDRLTRSPPSMAGYVQPAQLGGATMTLLVTRPRRSLAMYPALGMPLTSGAPVDIEETGDAFRVELDLPGVAPDDVEIELRDNEIRVFGTFGERRREGTVRHHARRTGEFEYIVALPGDVDPEGVQADLDAGVLTIVAPKAHGQQARRIEIHRKQQIVDSSVVPPEPSTEHLKSPDNPAAKAKRMKEGQSRPGPASQRAGSSGTGSTGQVGRSSMG